MKLTYIGAGSAVFARQLITDVLEVDGIEGGTFALVDLDTGRLSQAHKLVERLVERSGKKFNVVASTERTDVLRGSDYVVNSIEVAGPANVRHEYEIPLKYGVDQCIGDTIGPGGVFKMLRTGPTWIDILRDVRYLAPNAVVLNYTNPMSALTLAALRTTDLQVVGLCHSVQHTTGEICDYAGIPRDELVFECAGINHNSWFTRLEHQGQDLYPRLREAARDPEVYEKDPVRFEVMLRLGLFVTESSGHFSEYVPYFRKRPDLVQKYTRGGGLGESGWYANNWPGWRSMFEEQVAALVDGSAELPAGRSLEFASYIIEAIETNRPAVVYANVRNQGLVDNLPDGCVEVATTVDSAGLHPQHFGAIPEQLAALNRAHMAVHELLVQAVVERDRQAALYALMIDPLSAAACSLEEIENMFNELWEVERPYLPDFN